MFSLETQSQLQQLRGGRIRPERTATNAVQKLEQIIEELADAVVTLSVRIDALENSVSAGPPRAAVESRPKARRSRK
jgi:outer membrane murein-binding lipoprotein Lpp